MDQFLVIDYFSLFGDKFLLNLNGALALISLFHWPFSPVGNEVKQ